MSQQQEQICCNKSIYISYYFFILGNPVCPLDSKYKSKLNKDNKDLRQRPLDSFIPEVKTWFCKAPTGKNTLANMMATISQQGNYVNNTQTTQFVQQR